MYNHNPIVKSIRGFTFAGKHCGRDFGVALENKVISFPSKKKVIESVPFMNGTYDFSTIGSNGEIVYEERSIKITLGLPAENKENLHIMYSRIINWLVDSGKDKLIFDGMIDYYYIGEVRNASSLEETMYFGNIEIEFICEPFKYGIELVGSDIWDIFNFEEDWAAATKFNINGTSEVSIMNPCRWVRPNIWCDANMIMRLDGVDYNLVAGNNSFYGLHLQNGENKITFTGNGNVHVQFVKESL